jgi:hypothetical protein
VPDREQAQPSTQALQGQQAAQAKPGKPALRLVLPTEVYAGDQVEGWVEAIVAGTDRPYPRALAPATLKLEGQGQTDRPQVRLAEAVGRFFVEPTEAGKLTVIATAAGVEGSARATLTAKASVPRPHIYWEFDEPALDKDKDYKSDWKLSSDASAIPGARVARVDLPPGGVVTSDKQRLLLRVKLAGADQLNRANIRGVLFNLKVSPDFSCEDPNAHISVIMQSPANWWMPLGDIPISQARQWQSHTFNITNPKYIAAMPQAINVWFVLSAAKPAKGSVYIDRVGFMVR